MLALRCVGASPRWARVGGGAHRCAGVEPWHRPGGGAAACRPQGRAAACESHRASRAAKNMTPSERIRHEPSMRPRPVAPPGKEGLSVAGASHAPPQTGGSNHPTACVKFADGVDRWSNRFQETSVLRASDCLRILSGKTGLMWPDHRPPGCAPSRRRFGRLSLGWPGESASFARARPVAARRHGSRHLHSW